MDVEATERAIDLLDRAYWQCKPCSLGQSVVLGALYHLRTGLRGYLTKGEK